MAGGGAVSGMQWVQFETYSRISRSGYQQIVGSEICLQSPKEKLRLEIEMRNHFYREVGEITKRTIKGPKKELLKDRKIKSEQAKERK